MCKVLIVDDEPIAVEAVAYMIKKNIPELNIVQTARSGKDAIEKTYSYHPDIIIMDINMPGINGIDSMKQINATNPDISFIIISAFDYFDYAVEAIALGVEEFLVKPVKEIKLVETLRKVMIKIEQRRDNMKRDLEQQERLEMIVPILETGFINSLCMFDDNIKELQNYCELFNYKQSDGYVMAMEFGQKESKHIENKIGAGVQGEKMYEEYRKIIKSSCRCVVGPIMLNRIIVYVFDDSETENFEQKSEAIRLAQNIIRRASNIYPDIYIGVGRFHIGLSDSKKSYQEALRALNTLFNSEGDESSLNQILHVDDIIEKMDYAQTDYEHQFETEIYYYVAENDQNQVMVSFDRIYAKMQSDNNLDFETIKKNMVVLIVGFGKRWSNAIDNYCEVLSQILYTKDNNELFQICKRYINEAVQKISSVRQKKVNSIIDRADKYIEEHYAEELSLDDVAKEVNLSSYYFSRFYKEESGINFSDKLINVRIEKAKELLMKEELSIKDVSFMVGYMEPNYFSKIFKKVTGYTASEYKKVYGIS